MKIAYDARMAIGQYRGMGRFLRQLITGHERDFLGFCASEEKDPSLDLIPSGHSFFPLWEQVSLPSLIRQHGVDLFLAPYNTGPLRLALNLKLILVIHDLIYLEKLPSSISLYQNMGRVYRRIVMPRIIHRADTIVTVSTYTKEQLITRYEIAPDKIWVIPNSLDYKWFDSCEPARTYNNYIFMVAGEAPSKNLDRALKAYAAYSQISGKDACRLKVAGVKPKFHAVFRSSARSLGIVDQVDFLEYVSEPEMCNLYKQAVVFVMPSLMEGFGIPVLEAMACGVPVLASSTTSLPEVGGEAALYFDPTSVDNMASALSELIANPARRLQMSRSGREQAQRFHPQLVNQRVRHFWQAVCNLQIQ